MVVSLAMVEEVALEEREDREEPVDQELLFLVEMVDSEQLVELEEMEASLLTGDLVEREEEVDAVATVA